MEGCAFANFGNSSETERTLRQEKLVRKLIGLKREIKKCTKNKSEFLRQKLKLLDSLATFKKEFLNT